MDKLTKEDRSKIAALLWEGFCDAGRGVSAWVEAILNAGTQADAELVTSYGLQKDIPGLEEALVSLCWEENGVALALWKADLFEVEADTCGGCAGSGEGMYDGSRCGSCKGSGEGGLPGGYDDYDGY